MLPNFRTLIIILQEMHISASEVTALKSIHILKNHIPTIYFLEKLMIIVIKFIQAWKAKW